MKQLFKNSSAGQVDYAARQDKVTSKSDILHLITAHPKGKL